VIGDGSHLREGHSSHGHAEVNAKSLSEYEHDRRPFSSKPTVKCASWIGS